MVIGQFGETYPPVIDGVGHVMKAYCLALAKLGHTSYYVAPIDKNKTESKDIDTILYSGIPVPRQPYRVGKPELSSGYRKKIRETQFDIVHAHAPFLAGWAARRIARKQDIPLVSTFHTKYYDDMLEATHSKAFAKWVVKIIVDFYNTCDEVWTVNEDSKKVLEAYGYKGNIVIMPNGIDSDYMDREADLGRLGGLGIKKDVPILLFIGQVSQKKNLELTVKALSILKKENFPFQMLIGGQGPFEQQLRKMCRELGIEKDVQFLGFVSDRNLLHSLYAKADVFVLPSLYDTSSLVRVEAACAGTPSILIEGSAAAKGIEDGVNGFLCVNTPESLAAKIRESIPLAKETGEKAKQTLPVSWDKRVAEAEKRYKELIENHKKRQIK